MSPSPLLPAHVAKGLSPDDLIPKADIMSKDNFSQTWRIKTRVKDYIYEDVDFTGVDFNHPIFQNVAFKSCTFRRCNLGDARFYNSSFFDCRFDKVDLRGVTIGAHSESFANCLFKGCNLQWAVFYEPRFTHCIFDKCKMRGLEPRASYFENCKIIGHLSEIVFYNDYYDGVSDKQFHHLFHSIDFSQAVFGEYVIFEQCDLSKSTPPKGYAFDDLLTKKYSCSLAKGTSGIGTPAKEQA